MTDQQLKRKFVPEKCMQSDFCEIDVDLNDEHDDSLWINYKNSDAVKKLLKERKWDGWSPREEEFLENNIAILFKGYIVPLSTIKSDMKRFKDIDFLQSGV
jgi:hypothetical protein